MHHEPSPGDRIVLTASLVMAGVGLAGMTQLPSWQRELQVLGSPLGVGQLLSGRWLLVLLLGGITAAGVDALGRVGVRGPAVRPVDAAGTYASAGGGAPRPGYRMLAVYCGLAAHVVCVKFTGPESVVAAERARFLGFCASLRSR